MQQINIGVIANTHGIKGELKVKPLSDFVDQRFRKGKTVFVAFQNQAVPLQIQTVRENKGMLLVQFVGLLDINLVEKYKGCYITIPVSELHELEEDETYHYQLMHCEVVTTDNEVLGEVSEIIETGANDILRVVGPNDTMRLIPFVKAVVKSVDVEQKRIVVQMMEGL
ncbi:MAG: ribosome maturation factor RimM [Erysipelotrichaceae bacterium]